MKAVAGNAPFEPFFLPAGRGERFCIFHPAAGVARGALVYLHPFAEEMNKSRRMAAMQSRLLAAQGYGVLQIDLYGCGDSSGDFGEASWDFWKQDVALAVRWLKQRVPAPLHLWGLRLGALLALDYAADSAEPIAGHLLWQPVVSGAAFLAQFLRVQVAAGMLGTGEKVSTQDLRNELKAGATLEIGGYDLTPAMADAVERLKLSALAPRAAPVCWLEIAPEANRQLSPASRRVADAWAASGVELEVRTVAGESFWSAIEIADSPELLAETTRMFAEVPA